MPIKKQHITDTIIIKNIKNLGNANIIKTINITEKLSPTAQNLFIDTVLNRVGIGYTKPQATLDVGGDLIVRGNITSHNSNDISHYTIVEGGQTITLSDVVVNTEKKYILSSKRSTSAYISTSKGTVELNSVTSKRILVETQNGWIIPDNYYDSFFRQHNKEVS